jgi:hypothetical protein
MRRAGRIAWLVAALASCEAKPRPTMVDGAFALEDGSALVYWWDGARTEAGRRAYWLGRVDPDRMRWRAELDGAGQLHVRETLELADGIATVRLTRERADQTEVVIEGFDIAEGRPLWSTSVHAFPFARHSYPGSAIGIARKSTRAATLDVIETSTGAHDVIEIDRRSGQVVARSSLPDRWIRSIETVGDTAILQGRGETRLIDRQRRETVAPPAGLSSGLGCMSESEYVQVFATDTTAHGHQTLSIWKLDGSLQPASAEVFMGRASVGGCALYGPEILLAVEDREMNQALWKVDRVGTVLAKVTLGDLVGDDQLTALAFPLAALRGGPTTRFAPYPTRHRDRRLAQLLVIDHERLEIVWTHDFEGIVTTFQVEGVWYVAIDDGGTVQLVTIDGSTGMVLGAARLHDIAVIEPTSVGGGALWVTGKGWSKSGELSIARLESRSLWPTFISGELWVGPGTSWVRDILAAPQRSEIVQQED